MAVERGNVLHHVNREGELPGRGNVRGEYIRGNMSTGNAWTPAIAGEVLLKVLEGCLHWTWCESNRRPLIYESDTIRLDKFSRRHYNVKAGSRFVALPFCQPSLSISSDDVNISVSGVIESAHFVSRQI